MSAFRIKLPLLLAIVLTNLCGSFAGHTNLLAALGSHIDATCSDQKCDRNVNERLVSIIQSSMNFTADPCENFYNYACGNWTKTSKYKSSFEDQEEEFTQIYVDIFEKWREQVEAGNAKELKLNLAYEKAINYYSSCLAEEDIDMKNIAKNLEPAPQQKWPIYENRTSLPWNFENFIWWKVLAKLQSYDMTNVLLKVVVDNEWQQRLKYAVVISNSSPDKAISDIGERITLSMGNYTSLQVKLLRWKLLAFEKQLNAAIEGEKTEGENTVEEETESEENKKEAHAGDSDENSSTEQNKESSKEDVTKDYYTLLELQTEFPGIDWQEYFNILLQGDGITLPNEKIFKISDDQKHSIRRVITFLNNSSRETIALYLLAYFIEHVEGPLQYASSKKHCAKLLRSLMPVVADHIYEDNYYGAIRKESDAVIRNVFDRLRLKLNDLVEANSIDLTAKEIAYLQHKSNKMALIIGNLPANKSVDFLVEYYANVNITNATNFYHNHLELLHHKQLLNYRMLNAYHTNAKNVYESFDPVMGFAASASPYYIRPRNLIVLPYAYVQMPLYHHKLHDVFQYAELGFTTGHEIMHGFDEGGIWFDADGNINEIGVGISEKVGFEKKLECLTKVRTASISERIADVAGIRLVMEAFFNDRTSKAKKFHTHSTTLTNRQLFFVKLSQYFCQELDEDEEEVDLNSLTHDLSNVRVVYTMSNTREFAHEFQCDENTALKLDEVCQLW